MMKTERKVVIIDYQMCNLFSVKHVCDNIGLGVEITSDKHKLLNADAAILPGVGAFGMAMNNISKLDLLIPIKEFVNSGKPFMGICLGMQLLFAESEEFGNNKGLRLIEGRVTNFRSNFNHRNKIKVPHMGWNRISKTNSSKNIWRGSPLRGIKENEYMYFVHSYYAEPEDDNIILSIANYGGIEFCSSILHKNIFATQFHPEKNGIEGIKIYSNWSKNLSKYRYKEK